MYKSIAITKRTLRDSRIPEQFLAPDDVLPGPNVADVTGWIETSGQLSVEELLITASDGPKIASNIAARQWTALDVARAFCHRAVLAHQLTNCLLEVFMEEGLSRAQELDRIYSETGQLVGPLHGVPVLLKDNLNVKGHGTTLGIVGHAVDLAGAEWKAAEDAALVTILRRLGAVLYVKTNVPVAMMMPETNNHVYGNTTNPLNRGLSAGGSSGGEAALLCLRGAPMGVGSDIGGSIRIPASFANVYALRPSLGRFPTYGSRSGLPGLESVSSVNGPMAASWESLDMYCRAVVGAEPWQYDAKAVPLSWRQVELPPRLNFAVVEDDGVVRPTPPIRRGVRTAADRLRDAGHSVIPWDCRHHREANDIIGQFFLSDGGKHITDATTRATGEPLFPYMAPYGTADDVGVHGLWRLQARRTELMNEMLDQWNASARATPDGRPIDAIIMPASPYAGSPVNKFRLYVGYTSPWNLVDYSVGVVPVARADKTLDPRDDAPAGYGAVDSQVWADSGGVARRGRGRAGCRAKDGGGEGGSDDAGGGRGFEGWSREIENRLTQIENNTNRKTCTQIENYTNTRNTNSFCTQKKKNHKTQKNHKHKNHKHTPSPPHDLSYQLCSHCSLKTLTFHPRLLLIPNVS